jgi:hypothetical protein
MSPLLRKIKPASGFSYFLHLILLFVLPAAMFILVRLSFIQLALLIVVLSKWRMFAVRPRFWPANIRANAVDLMVGLSIVIFMAQTESFIIQLMWAALYTIWLTVIKPRSGIAMMTAQAFIGQLCALMALYVVWADGPVAGLALFTGTFCYLAARHFFDAFEEPYARMLSYVWGYFGAALAWLLSHWLLFYSIVSQPTLLLSTLGYGLAVMYYLDHYDRLGKGTRRQFVFIMVAVVVVVLAFSDWGDKVV